MDIRGQSPVPILVRLVRCAALLALLIAGACLGGAGAASASTVAVDNLFLRYVAAAGEANQLTITPIDRSALQVVDLGATIDAGDGCQQVGAHQARCTGEDGGPLFNAEVDAGDMNDTVILSVPSTVAGLLGEYVGLRADGGAGDDELRVDDTLDNRFGAWGDLDGGIGDDRLFGDNENDSLDGGGGRDELYGGRGDDRLTDGDNDQAVGATAPGPDLLDGGSGGEHPWQSTAPAGDRVSYSQRTKPVVIDLRVETPNGAPGEGDRIVRVEGAEGGNGNDTLRGSDVAGQLAGGGGDDVIAGGAGDEHITGGAGNDRLTGAAGDESIEAGSGDDRVWGGPGHDELWGGNDRDRLSGEAGRDRLNGDHGADRVLGGSGRDSLSGGTGDDMLRCGSDTDEVTDPRRDRVPVSCERIAFHKAAFDEGAAKFGMFVASHPSWRPWPWTALRLDCPRYQYEGYSNPRRRVSPAGELIVKARRAGRPLLARAWFSDASLTCADASGQGVTPARAPLTELGQRLAGRPGGVLATIWLKVHVVAPNGERAHFRAAWTTRLTRSSRSPTP